MDNKNILTIEEQQSLLNLARIEIGKRLDIDCSDYKYQPFELFKEERGAFVTIHLHGDLRGCIGYIEPVASIEETIKDMAISAAFRDPRFMPLSKDEFSEIDLEISILSPIELVKDPNEIIVGQDGLIITKNGKKGLLLPQVPVEQNWDRITFLEHLCLKAGLSPNSWLDNPVLQKFSAVVFGEKNDLYHYLKSCN